MFCIKCGRQFGDDDRFCPYCGNKVNEEIIRKIQGESKETNKSINVNWNKKVSEGAKKLSEGAQKLSDTTQKMAESTKRVSENVTNNVKENIKSENIKIKDSIEESAVKVRNATNKFKETVLKNKKIIIGVVAFVAIAVIAVFSVITIRNRNEFFKNPTKEQLYEIYKIGYYTPDKLPNSGRKALFGANKDADSSFAKTGDKICFANMKTESDEKLCMVVNRADDTSEVWLWSTSNQLMYKIKYAKHELVLYDEDMGQFCMVKEVLDVGNYLYHQVSRWYADDNIINFMNTIMFNIDSNTFNYMIADYLSDELSDTNLSNEYFISELLDAHYQKLSERCESTDGYILTERFESTAKAIRDIEMAMENTAYTIGSVYDYGFTPHVQIRLFDTPEEAWDAYNNGDIYQEGEAKDTEEPSDSMSEETSVDVGYYNDAQEEENSAGDAEGDVEENSANSDSVKIEVSSVSSGNPEYDSIISIYEKAMTGQDDSELAATGLWYYTDMRLEGSNLGYAYYDYDGDGKDELIIASEDQGRTMVWVIYEAYETGDGWNTAVVVQGYPRDAYYLLSGNRVVNEGSAGADNQSSATIYTYDESGIKSVEENVETNYENDLIRLDIHHFS